VTSQTENLLKSSYIL